MKVYVAWVWAFFLVSMFGTPRAAATAVNARIVDPKGKVTDVQVEIRTRWTGAEPPQLMLEARFPDTVTVVGLTTRGANLVEVKKNAAVVALRERDKSLNFTLDGNRNLLLDLNLEIFRTWEDAECRRLRIGLSALEEKGAAYHAGVRCAFRPDRRVVEVGIESHAGVGVPKDAVVIGESDYAEFEPTIVKQVQLQQGGTQRKVDVLTLPARKKFRFQVHAGPTFLSYSESPATVTTTDVGVGAGLSARWSHRRYGAEVGGRMSFVQFVHSSSQSARPWLVEAYAMGLWHLPIRLLGGGLSVLAGAHLTHMIVPGNTYGVSLSMGPEVGVEWHEEFRVLKPPRLRVQGRVGTMGFTPVHMTGTLMAAYRVSGLGAGLPLWVRVDGRVFSVGSSAVANTALGGSGMLSLMVDL